MPAHRQRTCIEGARIVAWLLAAGALTLACGAKAQTSPAFGTSSADTDPAIDRPDRAARPGGVVPPNLRGADDVPTYVPAGRRPITRNLTGEVPVASVPPAGPKPGAAPMAEPDYGSVAIRSNHARPVPRPNPRAKFQGQRKAARHPLPALEPYRTAPRPPRDPIVPPIDPTPAPNVAVVPVIPAKARPRTDADPFGALGVDVGSLRLFPYVELGAGYDTNPARVNAPVQGSVTERVEAGTTLQSLWSVHDLKGSLQAGYTRYRSQPTLSAPDAKGDLTFRADVTRETALDLGIRGTISTQQPGTPGLPTSLVDRPSVVTYGSTAGVTQKSGHLSLGLHGLIDRSDYADGKLAGGGVSPLSDETNTAYALQATAGYEIRPGITPFLKAEVGRRVHDSTLDENGYRRDSTGMSAEIGTSFELTRQLTGSIGAGYGERTYADARLPRMRGPIIDSSLVWNATPLTTVTLSAATTQAETTLAGASGALSQKVTLGVTHALFRNLSLGAEGSLQTNRYTGVSLNERVETGKLSATYNLSRSIAVKGSFTHERLRSSAIGADYTANVYLVGLRLQR